MPGVHKGLQPTPKTLRVFGSAEPKRYGPRAMNFRPYSKIFDCLVADIEARNIGFLVGAGVSMLPPCSLPSGIELKNAALFEFLSHSSLSSYATKIINHDKYKAIVPEIVFQRIYEALRDDLFPFFNVLNIANTNIAHLVLAFLAEKWNLSIFTTNFDLLIEKHITTYKHIITHLHGSLDNYSQMIIRINQVGRGLENNLKTILARSIEGQTLYVFGYSGNDKDIIDAISMCKPRRIIWIVRSCNDSFVLSNIKRIRTNADIIISECDLNTLFMDLSNQFLLSTSISNESETKKILINRKSYVENLSKKISLAKKFACYGKVLFDLHEYNLSSNVYVDAANKDLHDGVHSKYWFYAEAANCMRVTGDFSKGIEYAERVIQDKKSVNFLSSLSASYNVYGLILLEKDHPEPQQAIQYFSKAIKTLEKFRNSPGGASWKEGIKIFQGRFYNNLGLAFETANDFSKSIENYKKSLSLKKETGDLEGISQTSANIAILYYKYKKFSNSGYWKKYVLELSEKYQLYYQIAYLYRRIGTLSCEQGRKKYGIDLLRKSMDTLAKLEDAAFDIGLVKKALKTYNN